MKNFRTFSFVILLSIILILNINIGVSQPWPGMSLGEFIIINNTDSFNISGGGQKIIIKMYPVGAMFNGDNKYTPKALYPIGFNNPRLPTDSFIVGIQKLLYPNFIDQQNKYYIRGAFDGASSNNECNFEFGMTLYKVEFWSVTELNDPDTLINSFFVDWRDANINGYYPYDMDLIIEFWSGTFITFHFITDSQLHNIDTVGKHIKHWQQFGTTLQNLNRQPSLGAFTLDTSIQEYLKFPIDAKQFNGNIGHDNSGVISMNLLINHNATTRDTLIDTITNIKITNKSVLTVSANKTFDLITPVSPPLGHTNVIVEDSSGLSLLTNANIIIRDRTKLTLRQGSFVKAYPGSEIIVHSGGTFCNEGSEIVGPLRIRYLSGIFSICAVTSAFEIKDSSKIILSDSSALELPDDFILHISGKESSLILNPHSKIKFGENSKIIVDSSASLIANGATFTSADSTLKWEGILLSNSDADTITNCTFSNAVTALTITNDANSAYKNRIITNNTFNIPNGGIHKGIYGENNYKILLKGNTFNMPVYFPSSSPVPLIYIGVYLKNSSTIEAAGGDIEEDQSTNYSLNIIENTFSNGCASVILANYTSNFLPYIINDNVFNNTASVNIIGMKISGTIRDNTFTSEYVPIGIHLINSSPNLYKNTLNSRDAGLHLAGHCYPNLAPYASGEELVWTGGNNYITTTDIDNIQLSSSGYVNTDFGNNNFITDNSTAYHIYGWLDSTHNIYYARDNCWNGSNTSRIYLKTYGSSDTIPVPVINTNSYDCSGEISPTGWNVSYNGNGIYDSVKITDDYTGEVQTEENILYSQALADYNNGLPVQAIADFKYLIDYYPEFEKQADILYEFYSCYQLLDTNEGQNYREPLYQNIVDYFSEKILSDEYKNNSEFCDNAYDIILMAQCIIELNAAAGGYEFLAFYHPDPDIRLAASWNYAEIEEMLNSGEGGGERDLENGISDLEFDELKELQRLNELISDDPLMNKMKKSFEKTDVERKDRIDKQISSESKSGEIINEKIIRSRQIDLQKEDRAKRNVFELRNMSKEEKEMRRMEDIALSTLDIRNEIKINSRQSIPSEYNLEQNYPNPFNPVTTIKYSIPKNGVVTLKIYDVLGKEVMTLVNETKEAGNYEMEFNGNNFASGVYFYKLESGEFASIKRMILIK